MNGPWAALVGVVVSDGARVGIAPCLGKEEKGGGKGKEGGPIS